MTSPKVQHLFNQIESIKSTMSMKNGNKPELWVQRQNLQDLYHQIILNDIDFTIDKKLEQDLWNLVFKSQINFFQAQIKENSSSVSVGLSSGSSSGSNPSMISGSGLPIGNSFASKTNKNISSLKKHEAQASLFFFLEAARGFYTKLLEDIVLTYDSRERFNSADSFLLPFCQRFSSIFDKINNNVPTSHCNETLLVTDSIESATIESDPTIGEQIQHKSMAANKTAKEKQILYICQHILTHLGDIARYANLFQQAKNYYLHAIILVPYLGHPYNQLGILFETSRINQLSTVFYYFRSIAVRYKFPLATTNLENFLLKLIDIPLSRYNPSNVDVSETACIVSNQTDSFLIKLSHKDLITLYLQVNALIYLLANPNIQPKKTSHQIDEPLISRAHKYLTLFEYAFEAFVRTPLQREKLDAFQFCEMISISIFLLANSTANKSNETAIKLFAFMTEILIYLFNESLKNASTTATTILSPPATATPTTTIQSSSFQVDLVLPGIYLAVSYLASCDELNLILENKIWLTKRSSTSSFLNSTVQMLNTLNSETCSYKPTDPLIDLVNNYADYPLNEDRMLDSFLPLKNHQANLNIAKYMRSSQLLSDSNELFLRKKRIVDSFVSILIKDSPKKACFLELADQDVRFNVAESLLPTDFSTKKIQKTQNKSMEIPKPDETKSLALVTPPVVVAGVSVQENTESNFPRRRRQNVAIQSITQKNINQKLDANKPLAQPTTQRQNESLSTNQRPMNQANYMVNQNNNNNNYFNNNLAYSNENQQNNIPFNNLAINSLNAQQQVVNKLGQNLPVSQPQSNFFPSALNRKFPNQSDNFMNNTNLNLNASFPLSVNNQMLFKNRNAITNQDSNSNTNVNIYNRPMLTNEKNSSFFNPNNSYSNQNNNTINPMFKPLNQNPIQNVRPNFNSSESFSYNSNNFMNQNNHIRPNNFQYDLRKTMPPNSEGGNRQLEQLFQGQQQNQRQSFSSSFFNSNNMNDLDEFNLSRNVEKQTSSSIWPSTLPFNTDLPLDEGKPNSFWPSFTHPPLNQDLIKPHQSETNTALLELLQNSKPNDNSIINNTLLSNIFSQFNADSNASSNNSLNTNDTQSKSIWTPFPSNFN